MIAAVVRGRRRRWRRRRRRGRRRGEETVVEAAAFARRQAHRFVTSRELGSLTVHLGLVAHNHRHVSAFLGRTEYAPGSRGGCVMFDALPQPLFDRRRRRRFLAVAVYVLQHHRAASVYRCVTTRVLVDAFSDLCSDTNQTGREEKNIAPGHVRLRVWR